MHCGKAADRIQMPFGIIGRAGQGMRQVVGFGDLSIGRGIFGGEFGARHCNQWGLYGVRERQHKEYPKTLPKLLCADLFISSQCVSHNYISTRKKTYGRRPGDYVLPLCY